MFVPIRRDPIMFREAYSDASALQKNVKYREVRGGLPNTKQLIECENREEIYLRTRQMATERIHFN